MNIYICTFYIHVDSAYNIYIYIYIHICMLYMYMHGIPSVYCILYCMYKRSYNSVKHLPKNNHQNTQTSSTTELNPI